jgi:hypothetical protein
VEDICPNWEHVEARVAAYWYRGYPPQGIRGPLVRQRPHCKIIQSGERDSWSNVALMRPFAIEIHYWIASFALRLNNDMLRSYQTRYDKQ